MVDEGLHEAKSRPAAPAGCDDHPVNRSRVIGFAALVCLLLALVAVVVPVVGLVRAGSGPHVRLVQGRNSLTLPSGSRYGLFFNDTDNSGYSESCDVTDHGKHVPLSGPGFVITSSDTDNLDFVFHTGSGNLVIDCDTGGVEEVTTRPAPSYTAILVGGAAAALLGFGALVLAALWMAGRGSRARRPGS